MNIPKKLKGTLKKISLIINYTPLNNNDYARLITRIKRNNYTEQKNKTITPLRIHAILFYTYACTYISISLSIYTHYTLYVYAHVCYRLHTYTCIYYVLYYTLQDNLQPSFISRLRWHLTTREDLESRKNNARKDTHQSKHVVSDKNIPEIIPASGKKKVWEQKSVVVGSARLL